MSGITVWIEAEAGEGFAGWRQLVGAQAIEDLAALGSRGSATIVVHGGSLAHLNPTPSGIEQVEVELAGRRIAIANLEEGAGSFSRSAYRWFGFVDSASYDWSERRYTVECVEAGHQWAEVPLIGWADADGNAIDIRSANIDRGDGGIIGNAVDVAGDIRFLIDPATTSARKWTLGDLIDHAFEYAAPDDLELTTAFTTRAAEILKSEDAALAVALAGLSLSGLLDLVNQMGCFWVADYYGRSSSGAGEYTVFIFSASESTDALPIFPEATDSISGYQEIQEPVYDRIIVEGAPIVFCDTAKIGAGLDKGWTDAAQTAYDASLDPGDTANDADGVYSRYVLALTTGDFLNAAGDSFCQAVNFNNSTGVTTLGDAVNPDLRGLEPLRWIPWQSGGVPDQLDADEGGAPDYLTMLAFNYTGTPALDWCLNFGFPDSESNATPRIEPGNGPWVRVQFTPPHFMAPSQPWSLEAMNYNDLAVTLAIHSGQRLRVTIDNPATDPVADARQRRTLRLRNEQFKCHVAKGSAIVGMDNGNPITPGSTAIVRDDHAKALTLANDAAEWAFAKRASAVIEYAGYGPGFAAAIAFYAGFRLKNGDTDLGNIMSIGTRYDVDSAASIVRTMPSRASLARPTGTQNSALVSTASVSGETQRGPVRDGNAGASVMPVKMAQVDGTSGSLTTQCSYTYDLFTIGADTALDDPIRTAVYPTAGESLFSRPSLGARVAATRGLLYRHHDPAVGWALAWCNEIDAVEGCDE